MAKLTIEYDTKTKDISVKLDGEELPGVDYITISSYPLIDEDGKEETKYSVEITYDVQYRDEYKTHKSMYAGELDLKSPSDDIEKWLDCAKKS